MVQIADEPSKQAARHFGYESFHLRGRSGRRRGFKRDARALMPKLFGKTGALMIIMVHDFNLSCCSALRELSQYGGLPTWAMIAADKARTFRGRNRFCG